MVEKSSRATPITKRSTMMLQGFSSVFLPRVLDRCFPMLADAAADGAWMADWRGIAVFAPLFAFVVGLFGPALWPGMVAHMYTSSLSFMIVAIICAILNGTGGVTFLLGYIVGDLLSNPFSRSYGLSNRPYNFVNQPPALLDLLIVGALLINYSVLALLVIVVPRVARQMTKDIVFRVRTAFRRSAWIVFYGASCGLLAYIWSSLAVPLNRAVSTFRGSPSVPAALQHPLFTGWGWLVGAAVVTGVLRATLEQLATRSSSRPNLVTVLQQLRWSTMQQRGAFWTSLPSPLLSTLVALFIAFLLAGITNGWTGFLLTAVCIVLIQTLRYRLSSSLAWRRITAKVPMIFRFAFAFFVGFWFLSEWIGYAWKQHGWIDRFSFTPIVIGALLMLAILSVFFPGSRSMPVLERRTTK